MRTFERIQAEMKVWQAHNFPGRPDWLPLMGAVEELGELAQALKLNDSPEVFDAIADICIYLSDYCNGQGYDLAQLWSDALSLPAPLGGETVEGLVMSLGKLAHAHIKAFQNIRMHEDHPAQAKRAIQTIMLYLNRLVHRYSTALYLEDLVATVWLKVSKRDWQKNRDTAHLGTEGARTDDHA